MLQFDVANENSVTQQKGCSWSAWVYILNVLKGPVPEIVLMLILYSVCMLWAAEILLSCKYQVLVC